MIENFAVNGALPFCDISGFGELAWVELIGAKPGEVIRLEGPLKLINFRGRLRSARDLVLSEYVCTVSRLTDNGIQVLGGQLKRGEVIFVELAFTPLDVPGQEATVPELSGQDEPVQSEPVLSETAKPEPVKIPKLVADSSLPRSPIVYPPRAIEKQPLTNADKPTIKDRWSEAIAESHRVVTEAQENREGPDAPEVQIRSGDIVYHRQFGKCTVIRITDEHLILRKPDKRNVELGLAVLSFSRTGEEDGRPIYTIDVKTRR